MCALKSTVRPLAEAHADTHAFTNTLRQMLKCIVSARLTLTSAPAALNVQPSTPKWIKGWISVEGVHRRSAEIDASPSEA